jgi:hypothetical protein
LGRGSSHRKIKSSRTNSQTLAPGLAHEPSMARTRSRVARSRALDATALLREALLVAFGAYVGVTMAVEEACRKHAFVRVRIGSMSRASAPDWGSHGATPCPSHHRAMQMHLRLHDGLRVRRPWPCPEQRTPQHVVRHSSWLVAGRPARQPLRLLSLLSPPSSRRRRFHWSEKATILVARWRHWRRETPSPT